MPYSLLATDYDGTLAKDGRVEQSTLEALERWRQTGRSLVMVTGRQLDDLMRVCSCLDLFEYVIAENGALLYEPASQQEMLLAEPPPPELAETLRDRIAGLDHAFEASSEFSKLIHTENIAAVGEGRVVVATWLPHLETVHTLLEELRLDSSIILNKEAVMVLPKGVDKATGLESAIRQLDIEFEHTVGVGDAENDLPFLLRCGLSVAVANALDEVKQQVQWVTDRSRGAGVAELIERVLNDGS